MRQCYKGHVPGGADLVCYWFEKARAQIAAGWLQAAGLVATNSIRGGANRKVLDRILASTRIFEAWSDEPWTNNGAAVRVSLVGFGSPLGLERDCRLNGASVTTIHADLTAGCHSEETADITQACALSENAGVSFQGPVLVGPFEVEGERARALAEGAESAWPTEQRGFASTDQRERHYKPLAWSVGRRFRCTVAG
ncbi:MAG: hypothetical protein MZV65_50720 [Chromatiales bacterium]|nr:hypothetical protein [Chromatiales bacterium]